MRPSSVRFLSAALLTFALVNSIRIDSQVVPGQLSAQLRLNGDRVEAKSSGGRSRSGSFQRSPSSSGSNSSRSNSSGSSSNRDRQTTPIRPVRPVRPISPAPVYHPPIILHDRGSLQPSSSNDRLPSGSNSTSGDDFLALVILGLVLLGAVGMGVAIFYLLKRRQSAASTGELDNEIVTVTKLQVALLAQARQIQTDLTTLALEVDTETPDGMNQLLQESVLALLRSPENWTHTAVNSQTVKTREEAGQLFEQLSIEERSKFDVEALVNVGDRVRRQAIQVDQVEPAAYIVVTLLLGTETDRPLVERLHTAEELQTALQSIAALPPTHLSVFELLWSPQDAADSLTYDELLTEYSGLIQIA
jgi:uncharacterized membrane protein